MRLSQFFAFAFTGAALLLTTGCVTIPGSGGSQKSWIGLNGQGISNADVEVLGLQVDEGVMVRMMIVGSPAQQASLEIGDIIVSADETTVTSEADLAEYFKTKLPGSRVYLNVLREGVGMKKILILVGAEEDAKKLSKMTFKMGSST